MKTLTLKPAGAALNLREIISSVVNILKSHLVGIAVAAAIVSFGSMLLGYIITADISGAIALLIAGTDCRVAKEGGVL